MIDGGIFLGMDATSSLGLGLDALVAAMDAAGTGHALGASFKATHFDYREGNEDTLAIYRQSGGRILPMATINLMGHDCGGGYLEDLKSSGFKALGLFAQFQGWGWRDYSFRAVAKQCAALDLPLQVGLSSRQDLGDVIAGLADSGGTVLVRWMRGGGYNAVSEIIAAGRDMPSLIFDVGTVCQSGAIELLIERLGADRLYFATNTPLSASWAAHFILWAARLSAADRHMIQYGTLAAALGMAPAAPAAPPAVWERFRDAPKIDTHWHTSGWNIIEPRIDISSMREEFDLFNYRAVISNSIRALNDDLRAGNAETLAFIEADSRVRGLVVVNPLQVEQSIAEIERYRDHPRFVGIKSIQDFYAKDLDDAGYAAIFEHLRSIPDWPIMAHLGGMRRAALAFPDLGFVAAHSTWRFQELADLPNIWFDIATSTSLRGECDLGLLVDTVGPDRVILSCDGQLMSPAWTLGKLASFDIDDATLDKILNRNAMLAFPRLAVA